MTAAGSLVAAVLSLAGIVAVFAVLCWVVLPPPPRRAPVPEPGQGRDVLQDRPGRRTGGRRPDTPPVPPAPASSPRRVVVHAWGPVVEDRDGQRVQSCTDTGCRAQYVDGFLTGRPG